MRAASLVVGAIILGATWAGPLPTLAQSAFFAHMLMHMNVVALAAAFLALGVAGSTLDPVRHFPAWFAPIPLSLFELVVVWAWHTPGLHHAARASLGGLAAEQALFLFCGLALWLSAVGGDVPRCRNRTASGIFALLLTSMHMTLLGALLALSPRPLYSHMHGYGSWSALQDQHLGGAIMLVVGGIAYLTGGLWLTKDLLYQPAVKVGSKV